MAQSPIETTPTNIIVLGRDWESVAGERPLLSMEARMTVLALGALAAEGNVENIVFSGGLTADNGATEADAMQDYFVKRFPEEARAITLHRDGDCYDTATSAHNVKQMLGADAQANNILLGTAAHMKRATKIFEHEGIRVSPVAAEPVLADVSEHYRDFTERYKFTPRNLRYALSEAVLRSIMLVDKDAKLSKRLASHTRQNRN